MSETGMTDLSNMPDSLADMLPVGMIAAGGTAALAMAAVASRKQAQAGWEAFHYERMSASEFEITGGIAIGSGSSKKFQGAHTAVSITEAEILAEMRQQLTTTASETSRPAVTVTPTANTPAAITDLATGLNKATLLKVIFSLPEDEAGQLRILRAFQLQADFSVPGYRLAPCTMPACSNLIELSSV